MQVIAIVAPIFVLIAIGFIAVRSHYLSDTAQKGLSEFVFKLAIPALLFRTLARDTAHSADPLKIWIAYFGSVAIIWLAASLTCRYILRRPSLDTATFAMTAVYGNVVMIGIPLCLAAFGDAAATPIAIILTINTPVMWFVGTLHHQWNARDSGKPTSAIAIELATSLLTNPLIIAILAGGAWRLTELGIAPAIDNILKLLGQAGIPCALIALGASLTRFAIKGQTGTLSALLILKLAIMPAVAWLIAVRLLDLPPAVAGVILIFAATPAGANAYLFADKTGRVINSTSGSIALGTVLSAASISVLLAVITAQAIMP